MVVIKIIPRPNGYNAGISNTLKGFITALSIHNKTTIECDDDYELGNFDTILHDKYIFKPTSEQTEDFYSWRWLILKKEETLQQNIPDSFFDGKVNLNQNKYKHLFTGKVTIDGNFDKSLIHPVVYHRIMKSLCSIEFKPIIYKNVNRYDISFQTSLGISVRTWTASHEKNVNRKYKFEEYKKAIEDALSPTIKTIVLSIDNKSSKIEKSYVKLIESISSANIIIFREEDVNHLQYSIIKLLLLSKCGILIGNKLSTFTELSFWFSGCNQKVIPVGKK